MPTQEVIDARLVELIQTADAGYKDLRATFEKALLASPTAAMDHFGTELAELEYYRNLVRYACRNGDALPGVLEHSESVILRGDWQPVSGCAMHRALHQAQSLARCKFIKRLREVLRDEV